MVRRLAIACATSSLLTFAVTFAACSGRYIDDDPVDAGADTTPAIDTTTIADVVDLEAADAWHKRFDAPFDPHDPPAEGAFPAPGGLCPEASCPAHTACDEVTGWCCAGRWREGRCTCGAGLGCAASEVCCLADAAAASPSCVASAVSCAVTP